MRFFTRECLLVLTGMMFLFSHYAMADNPNRLSYVIESDETFIKGMVFGLGEGIRTANVVAKVTKGVEVICDPDDMRFSPDDYHNLLKTFYLKNNREDMSVSVAMHFALADAFPCR